MRAGLEEYLEHGNGEIEEESGQKTRAKKKAQPKKQLSKAPGAKVPKKKNKIANISSLGSRSNALDADLPALGVDNAKTKSMALKALLAGVPLENQREARTDKAAILRATRLLGFRRVSPDGLGAWKLKGNLSPSTTSWAFSHSIDEGMATHLWNHQVIASGFMVSSTIKHESPQLMIQSVSGRLALECHLEVCWRTKWALAVSFIMMRLACYLTHSHLIETVEIIGMPVWSF